MRTTHNDGITTMDAHYCSAVAKRARYVVDKSLVAEASEVDDRYGIDHETRQDMVGRIRGDIVPGATDATNVTANEARGRDSDEAMAVVSEDAALSYSYAARGTSQAYGRRLGDYTIGMAGNYSHSVRPFATYVAKWNGHDGAHRPRKNEALANLDDAGRTWVKTERKRVASDDRYSQWTDAQREALVELTFAEYLKRRANGKRLTKADRASVERAMVNATALATSAGSWADADR